MGNPLADLIKGRMKEKLQERERVLGGGGPTLEKMQTHQHGTRVNDRAGQRFVDMAQNAFGRALSPNRGTAQDVQKSPPPRPVTRLEKAMVPVDDTAEAALLSSMLDHFISKSRTLSPEIVEGLKMIRDAVNPED